MDFFTFTHETLSMFYKCSFIAKPSPPANLNVHSKTTQSIYIRWSEPVNNNGVSISNYTVYYRSLEEHFFKTHTSVLTYLNLTSLKPGKTYIIKVTAVNRLYEGDGSIPIIETTRIAGKFIKKIFPYEVY